MRPRFAHQDSISSPFVICCTNQCALDPLGQVSPCQRGPAMQTHRNSRAVSTPLAPDPEEPSHLQDGAHSAMSMEMLMYKRKPPVRGFSTQLSLSLCVLCACLCMHPMPAHVCACMYVTQKMEPSVSGMLDSWASPPQFSLP